MVTRRTALFLSAIAVLEACRRPPRVPTRTLAGRKEELDTEDGIVPIDGDDPQQGPLSATCVLVVFSDFQCPFCKEAAAILHRLRKELPLSTRLVFKHLPIPGHKDARVAAIASQIVYLEAGSAAFFQFHDRCFANPHALTPSNLVAWAAELGVGPEAIEKRAPAAQLRVSEDLALGERLGVAGTPRQYVNRRRVQGAYPYEVMRAWVDEEV